MNYQEALILMENTGCSCTLVEWSPVSQDKLQIYLDEENILRIQEEDKPPRELKLSNSYKQKTWIVYEGSYDLYSDIIKNKLEQQAIEEANDDAILIELESEVGVLFDKMIQLKLLRNKVNSRVNSNGYFPNYL